MPVPRSLVLLVLVASAMPVLAGCATVAANEATAEDHREMAEERAREWDEDAQLVRVIGVEGRHGEHFAGVDSRPTNRSFWHGAVDDGDVGDGRCVVWTYRFVAEQPDPSHAYRVAIQDGEIVSTGLRANPDATEPLPEGLIDSDEAAQAARDAHEGIDEGLDGDDPGLTLQLVHDEEEDVPVWRVVGGGGQGTGGAVVLDARTGGIIDAGG